MKEFLIIARKNARANIWWKMLQDKKAAMQFLIFYQTPVLYLNPTF
jgi:hypothetical protein